MDLKDLQETGRLNLSGFIDLNKSVLSEQDFNKKYLTGKHEIYTEKSISDFKKAISNELVKGEMDAEGLKITNNELSQLKRIEFMKGDTVVGVFVKSIGDNDLLSKGGAGSGRKKGSGSNSSEIDHAKQADHHYDAASKIHKKYDAFDENGKRTGPNVSPSKYSDEDKASLKHHNTQEKLHSNALKEQKKTKKSFDDDNDLEKGMVTDSFGSYSNNKLSFNKTGKQIKDQINTILLVLLQAQQANLELQLTTVAKEITAEPDSFVGEYNYRGFSKVLPRVARYSYNQFESCDSNGRSLQTDDGKNCRLYNEVAENIVSTMADIQYATLLARNVEETKKYELTSDQVLALQF